MPWSAGGWRLQGQSRPAPAGSAGSAAAGAVRRRVVLVLVLAVVLRSVLAGGRTDDRSTRRLAVGGWRGACLGGVLRRCAAGRRRAEDPGLVVAAGPHGVLPELRDDA